jgi:leader peptidase (prepilin peptidase) / N-methyltransferase
MGFGDVRLAAVLGAVLGWYGLGYVLWGLFVGHVFALLMGLLIGMRRHRLRGLKIAFGPPLIAGTLLVVLLGGSQPSAEPDGAGAPRPDPRISSILAM